MLKSQELVSEINNEMDKPFSKLDKKIKKCKLSILRRKRGHHY